MVSQIIIKTFCLRFSWAIIGEDKIARLSVLLENYKDQSMKKIWGVARVNTVYWQKAMLPVIIEPYTLVKVQLN